MSRELTCKIHEDGSGKFSWQHSRKVQVYLFFFGPVIFSLPLSKVEQTFGTFAKVLWVIEAPREGFYNFRLSMKFLPVLRIFRVSKYEV